MYPCLGGAARQEVLVVSKPGDVEESTRLQLRLGRHKPPLKGAERITLFFLFSPRLL